MKMTNAILRLAVIVLSIGFASTTIAGPLEDGWAAFDAGNFEAAFKAFSKAAEQGSAEALNKPGRRYEDGNWVPQDYKQTV